MWSKVNVIEHKLMAEIKNILHMRQTRLKGKESLVKYKSCHHKEVVWMQLAHLDHLPEIW
jgi:DNA-directed RNA polymerase subunit M/transcription elongation factor TFIIS